MVSKTGRDRCGVIKGIILVIYLGRERTGRAALPQELDHRGALGMGGGGAESFGREHLADRDRPIGQRKQAEGEE
jgi:hypothetical protein